MPAEAETAETPGAAAEAERTTMFYSPLQPPYDLECYVGRLLQGMHSSAPAFTTEREYLGLVQVVAPGQQLRCWNGPVFLMTAVVLAAKYFLC